MADKGNDPAAIWQNMIGEMEKGFNSFANQAMASPEFSKVMNQVGGVTAGAQKQLGELMEKYLVSMNLPSRAQMVSMAERLQSIEGQLNEIKAMLNAMNSNAAASAGRYAGATKPPRTSARRAPLEIPRTRSTSFALKTCMGPHFYANRRFAGRPQQPETFPRLYCTVRSKAPRCRYQAFAASRRARLTARAKCASAAIHFEASSPSWRR